MYSKLIRFLLLHAICLTGITAQGQNRLPVHARVSLTQKMFEKPECTVNIQELKFEGKRSHSVGIGFGLDFGLNQADSGEVQWILQTNGNLFSTPVKYSASMPKEIHGFDRDVAWDFERHAAGFEASVGIIRQTQLNQSWNIRFGFGANIQDMYISPSILQHSVVIRQNGIAQPVQVVGAAFDPLTFGPTRRQKQDLQFNAVYTLGFSKNIDEQSMFIIDLRVCLSGQDVIEPFNFTFGDSGDFKFKKSFVGIDLAYRFSLNRSLSQARI